VTLEQVGPALAMASLAAVAAARCGLHRTAVAGIAAIVFGGALVPIGGISAAGYALGFPGVLSAATLAMALQLLLWALGARKWARPSLTFLVCLTASGLLLYPTATGLLAFDLYDLGFRGVAVPALMAAFVVAGWRSGARDVAIWIGGAALLYLCGAYASVNLWDYLIDPVGFLAAIALLGVRAFARRAHEPRV
jgi:hypothetical protein